MELMVFLESGVTFMSQTLSTEKGNAEKHKKQGMLVLGVSALGIVFGDIGTSPLYTLKTVLILSGETPSPAVIFGLLSLIIWTLIIITTIKYVTFAMRIDNNGEGGILALMALLSKKHKRPFVIAAGLLGTALIYGDGAITPAISVLSALEGLKIVFPDAQPYILPATVIILVSLFAIQPFGTARIGIIFGPVIVLWFLSLAALGCWGIIQYPSILLAINPLYGLNFILSEGYVSFLIIGGVFLCVTGAEALYADMGHFGARPIRMAWSCIVFPSLVLNYAGQSALVLAGANIADNIFYRLCPAPLLIPLVILATMATVIASQSMITGTFSLTRQAIQLGWLPRLRIKQTSARGYGQIYVGVVNWLLMIVTVGLALSFKSSDNLAAAYGVAVSLTMLMTSCLLFIAMREIWGWSIWVSGSIAGCFLLIDIGFLTANLLKILEGGYIPLVLASMICIVMMVWHKGSNSVSYVLSEKAIPVPEFLEELEEKKVPRVPGLAIFLTRTVKDTPPVMRWHVRRNYSLHEKLLALNVEVTTVPWADDSDRFTIEQVGPNFWRAHAFYGFMERPDIPNLLKDVEALTGELKAGNITYYLGHETIIGRENDSSMPKWQRVMFSFMVRNGMRATDFFHLSRDQVVEIGRQIEI